MEYMDVGNICAVYCVASWYLYGRGCIYSCIPVMLSVSQGWCGEWDVTVLSADVLTGADQISVSQTS